jgi:MYXO-CTERM domain-containing protein
VFVRSTRMNCVVSLLFILAMGACGNFGGCGACGSTQPLPGGKLPTDQTIEGGAQVRVTPAGFQKLTSIVPGILNQSLANGICVPGGQAGVSILGFPVAQAKYCQQNSGAGCTNGCKISVGLNNNGFTTQVVNNNLRINLSTKLDTTIHLDFIALGFEVDECDMRIQSSNLNGSFDVAFGIKPADGELDIRLANINSFTMNLQWSNCGIISSIGGLLTSLIDAIPNSIKGLLTPLINPLIQNFLPNPLGIKGMIDIGNLMAGISPGTDGFMEARMVPGGYVNLANNGMSLGVITGLNADEDPATRTPELDSEPHLCVPPLPAPVYSQPPYSLPQIARSGLGGSTFQLNPAGAFAGTNDPAADLAMGISETTLDLAGHHLTTSGGMCLGVGTPLIKQLNVGTIGILVPSLAELQSDKGNDPLLLVTRPQKAVDFTIGDNTASSPAITIHLKNMEVDFYAFIWERYVRAFTLDLTMNVGINLTFEQMGTAPAVIKPELVGISSKEVTVKVLNSQFVRETPANLEKVLPSVFDLITPLLGNLPDIQVPSFAGFSLNNLSIQKVVTSQDEFLALYATLGSSTMMRTLGTQDVFAAEAVRNMDMQIAPTQAPSTGRARLVDVVTPDAETIRSALLEQPGGALPSIKFDVDRVDSRGRTLEWSWNINGGFWRPFTSGSPLVISDRAFAWQGKYEIGLKSRVVGDYRTVSEVIRTPVVIDSVGPNIFADNVKLDDGQFKVPVWDVVYGKDVEVAFGYVGDDAPATNWVPAREASLAVQTAHMLSKDHRGELAVFARDEQGNQSVALIAPFHGQAGESGCSCETSGTPGVGSLILIGLVGLGIFGSRGRRRGRSVRRAIVIAKRVAKSRVVRNVGMFTVIVVATSFVPGCSCGEKAAQACETAADCGPDFCPEGQLPFCIDNTCVCSDDIPPGRIGPYSDVAVTQGGEIWVSAYASSHGDLVVAKASGGRIPNEAWEWVDGIPDGPVIVPDSKIRGGIAEPGPDVGMYTSIAVTPSGIPMVSYFDRDTASLKLAVRTPDGVWKTSTVELGTSQIDPGAGGSLIGMYTSLTVRSDNGRAGIAYLAHMADANGLRAEVRYASAQTEFPTGPGDWQFWTVDTAAVPEDPDEIYPLPGGLGLFVDSARNPTNQAPHVVYYDRAMGDLKLAKFNVSTGQFATSILDGTNGVDAGWSPTIQVDDTGVSHVAYVGATGDNLMYTTDAAMAKKEIIDDGYRIVGTTVDGLPKPEFHFVGDDAGLVLPPGGGAPMVVYQDATTQQLLLSQRQTDGTWARVEIAGATMPWPGAYGFFASAALTAQDIVMSTWVIDQPEADNWVEVFTRPTVIK